jgi:hypothetical protein
MWGNLSMPVDAMASTGQNALAGLRGGGCTVRYEALCVATTQRRAGEGAASVPG